MPSAPSTVTCDAKWYSTVWNMNLYESIRPVAAWGWQCTWKTKAKPHHIQYMMTHVHSTPTASCLVWIYVPCKEKLAIVCRNCLSLPTSAHNPLTRVLRLVLDSSAQLLLNDFMTLEGSRIDQLLDGICEPVLNAWNLKQQKDIRDQQVWLHVCSTARMMSFTLANPQAE